MLSSSAGAIELDMEIGAVKPLHAFAYRVAVGARAIQFHKIAKVDDVDKELILYLGADFPSFLNSQVNECHDGANGALIVDMGCFGVTLCGSYYLYGVGAKAIDGRKRVGAARIGIALAHAAPENAVP